MAAWGFSRNVLTLIAFKRKIIHIKVSSVRKQITAQYSAACALFFSFFRVYATWVTRHFHACLRLGCFFNPLPSPFHLERSLAFSSGYLTGRCLCKYSPPGSNRYLIPRPTTTTTSITITPPAPVTWQLAASFLLSVWSPKQTRLSIQPTESLFRAAVRTWDGSSFRELRPEQKTTPPWTGQKQDKGFGILL